MVRGKCKDRGWPGLGARFFAFLLAVVFAAHGQSPSPEYQDALWVGKVDGLTRLAAADGTSLFELRDRKSVAAIAIDQHAGMVWVYAGERLRALSLTGQLLKDIPIAAPRKKAGEFVDLAVNSAAGAIWLSVGKTLRQYNTAGDLVGTTSSKAPIRSLAFDEAGGRLWVAAKNTVTCLDASAQQLKVITLPKTAVIKKIDIDAASGEVWVASANLLQRFDRQGAEQFKLPLAGLMRFAADGQGGAWITRLNATSGSESLSHLGTDGKLAFTLMPFAKPVRIIALAAHAKDASIWVASNRDLVHIDPSQQKLQKAMVKGAVREIALYADNVGPEVSFSFPVDGAVVNDSTPTIQLDYSDAGSGIESVQLTFNGTDVTAQSAIGATGATYMIGSALAAGEHLVSAVVTDKAGNTRTATSKFKVNVFRAFADCAPTTGSAPLQVRLRTRGEFTGGTIVRYRWDFQGDGIFDTSDSVALDYNFTYRQKGTFHPLLEVTNNLGQTATDTATIEVAGGKPSVVANALPSNGQIPLDVNFTCTATDPDGSIVLFEWDFDGDGVYDFSSATQSSVTHTYGTMGGFTASCRVTDDTGLTATARTTTLAIDARPPGSPSVQASANNSTSRAAGNTPYAVNFTATLFTGGPIVLWEWDYEGDGTYDFSSAASPNASFTYTQSGIFAARVRATNEQGLTSTDTVEVESSLVPTLTVPVDTFDPSAAQTVAINTSLNGPAPVRLLVKDAGGSIVRTLAEGVRAAGAYSDSWDGKNDAGHVLPQAPYYAVLEYMFAGETRAIDLSTTTGGVRYSPSRNSLPSTFKPFDDNLLSITFTVPANQGASEVQAFVGLFNTDTRFVTLVDRVPFGVGTHTIFWDGRDANGNAAVPPPGDSFLFGSFGFTLPNNAIFIQSAPVLSGVTVTPNFFNPATGNFVTADEPQATVSFNLNKAATVQLTVTSLKTGAVLRRINYANAPAGNGSTIVWDGRSDGGVLVAKGDYRLSLQATDSIGSASITRFALVRIFY